jgi:hypothetical protein
MAKNFDKHGWLQAVQGSTDPKFSDREFRIAFIICSQFTWRDGKGWTFDVVDVVKVCPANPSLERTIKTMAKLCKAGFLEEEYRRDTGPGLRAQRAFNLQNTGTPASGCSGEHRDRTAEHRDGNEEHRDATTEHRDGNDPTPGRKRPNTGTPASSETPAYQAEGDPQGISEGISEGVYQGMYQGDLQGGYTRVECSDCRKPLFSPHERDAAMCNTCAAAEEKSA